MAGNLAPCVPGRPLTGSTLDLKRDPLGLFQRAAELGDVARMQFPLVTLHLLSNPEHVKRVLVQQHRNYNKQTNGHRVLRLFLGEGMLMSEGEAWRKRRRIAQPAFHHQELARFALVMQQSADELLARLSDGEIVDIDAEMMAISLKIVGLALLNTDLSDRSQVVSTALTTVLDQMMDRVTFLFDDWLYPPEDLARFNEALSRLDSLVDDIIVQHRRKPPAERDLLSMLISARDDETGEGLDARGLRDEVMTMIMAGHETTANALTWSVHLLSINEKPAQKLRAELKKVLGGRKPTLDDLPRLTYTRSVIDEAMRLYPPAWVIGRSVIEEDEIDGFVIPAGSNVVMSPWIIHRDPRFWPDPLKFKPERFAAGTEAPRHAYFPFGAGPRLCIGAGFAMIEATLVLASLAQHYRFEPVDAEVTPWPTVSLRPRGGLRVKLAAI